MDFTLNFKRQGTEFPIYAWFAISRPGFPTNHPSDVHAELVVVLFGASDIRH